LADSTFTVNKFDLDRVEVNRYLNEDEYKNGREYRSYELTETGISPRIIPGRIKGTRVLADSDEHDEYGRITESGEVRVAMTRKRFKKLDLLEEELLEPFYYGGEDIDVLLLGWGSLDGPIREAVELLNKDSSRKYGALVFGDIWPLPTKLLEEKASKAKVLVNVEQNVTGQLASIIMEVTGRRCNNSILKFDGRPLSGEEIYEKLKGEEEI